MSDEDFKVLALLSGGLDSTLAVKAMLEQGVEMEAINFTTPFCLCDKCAVESVGGEWGVRVHRIYLGEEFLDLVADPPHGYGSQMNPCIDCRIMMLRKAKEVARSMGATCVMTGEVLGQRPFSQRREAMLHIEREAGLEGRVLRPLSAHLLPETECERMGLIDREKLHSIQGRRRLPQMRLAEEWGIKDYPCPAGGCLLTDPHFAARLRDLLEHNSEATLDDVSLLKLGRHFRVEGRKVVVGRDEEENQALLSIARRENKAYLEVIDYAGPITLIDGNDIKDIIDTAAGITVRYSDAPKGVKVKVRHVGHTQRILTSLAAQDKDIRSLMIK